LVWDLRACSDQDRKTWSGCKNEIRQSTWQILPVLAIGKLNRNESPTGARAGEHRRSKRSPAWITEDRSDAKELKGPAQDLHGKGRKMENMAHSRLKNTRPVAAVGGRKTKLKTNQT
jgi:hypothetical protein